MSKPPVQFWTSMDLENLQRNGLPLDQRSAFARLLNGAGREVVKSDSAI